jgi:hypothetical protein
MSSTAHASTASDWRPSLLARLIQVCVLASGVYLNLVRVYVLVGYDGNDWGKFYWDAVAWLDGRPMYVANPATWIRATNTYGQHFLDLAAPHFLLPFLLVGRLGFPASIMVWATTAAFGAGLAYRIVVRELGAPSDRTVFYAIPILFLSDLVGSVTVTGQISFQVLPIVAQTWVWARHERWDRAALGLGVLIAIKPFFLLLLPWMAWRGSWKAVPLAIASFSFVVALGLAVFGVETYRTWLDTLASADWSWVPMNASLRAPITRALTVNPAYPHFADAPALAALVWRIAFVVLCTVVLAIAALDRRDGWRDRGMALLLVSAIFLSPLGWTYYLWWTLPPLLAVLLQNPRSKARDALLVSSAVIFGSPSLLLPIDPTWPLGHLVSGTQVIGLACLWLACVQESAVALRAGLPLRNAWYGRVAPEPP